MEVRAWSGIGWWEVLLPGVGVVAVQPAGAVQRLLGLTDRQPAWQHRVLIPVAAGQVDGKPPQAGGAAVAQPAQRQDLAGRGVLPRARVSGLCGGVELGEQGVWE